MASPFDASLLEVQVADPSLLRRLDSVLSVAYLGWRMSTPGSGSLFRRQLRGRAFPPKLTAS